PDAAGDQPAAGVEGDGDDDDESADDVLEEGIELHDAHEVVEHGEDRHAADRAPDRAPPAHEHRAAEDDGGDREPIIAALGPDRGASDAQPARQQQSGQARAHGAADVRADERQPFADAREPGDLRIAAD